MLQQLRRCLRSWRSNAAGWHRIDQRRGETRSKRAADKIAKARSTRCSEQALRGDARALCRTARSEGQHGCVMVPKAARVLQPALYCREQKQVTWARTGAVLHVVQVYPPTQSFASVTAVERAKLSGYLPPGCCARNPFEDRGIRHAQRLILRLKGRLMAVTAASRCNSAVMGPGEPNSTMHLLRGHLPCNPTKTLCQLPSCETAQVSLPTVL